MTTPVSPEVDFSIEIGMEAALLSQEEEVVTDGSEKSDEW
jgi:hypothetical protein